MALSTPRTNITTTTTARRRIAATLGALGVLGLGTATLGAPDAGAAKATSIVEVAKVANLGSVLVTAQHQTLYVFTLDTASKLACTGGCTKVWPPLLLPKGTKKIDAKGIKGLSTRKRGNRLQVQLDHRPLYRFAGDTKAGMDKGQGVENSWSAIHSNGATATVAAVTPTTAATTTTAPATTTTAKPAVAPTTAKPVTTTTRPVTTTTQAPTTTTTKAPPPTTTPTTSGGGGYGY